ncbi:MAG: hypothetical protein ACXIVQ_08990 [Acidimicrobiales bacterium]
MPSAPSPGDLEVDDVRPFVPARDIARSRRFYSALGWATIWTDGSMDLLERGAHRFYLQDFYVKEWAENFVLVVMVADPIAWHQYVATVLADGDYGDARVTEPVVEEWGATVTHVWDPSGVLLHIMKLDD